MNAFPIGSSTCFCACLLQDNLPLALCFKQLQIVRHQHSPFSWHCLQKTVVSQVVSRIKHFSQCVL